MRDAHASWIPSGGADIQVAKERLGHGSITTTEQYLGTLPGAGEAALAALNIIRGPRGEAAATEPPPESAITEDKAPDMADLLKMMATIKDTVERLSA